MFAKLVVLILSMGLVACTLLTARQLRTQAAHELAEAHLRGLQRDNDLWRLRAQIAQRVSPDNVKRMALSLQDFKPMASGLPAPVTPPPQTPPPPARPRTRGPLAGAGPERDR